MSRTAAIARGLTVGYGFQAAVAVTGLALTPFLLGRLGADDYGRWLVAGQVLGLLGLLDLGVAALVPREVARASGGAGVADVTGRAWWLVAVQTPVVALVAAGAWWWAAAERPELAGPLAVVLTGFVAQFPLRLAAAVLNGLQDFAYTGAVQATAWAVTTALSVGLVIAGCGLYALAVGWAVGQLIGCGLAWRRVRTAFPAARGGRTWPGWIGLWGQLRASLWVSLAQLAQVLTAGTDLLVIGWVLGPAAAVGYGCTVKLVAVLTNPCYAIALTAQPALAQLAGGGGDPVRLHAALRAVGLAVLVVGGGVGVAVAAGNAAFVSAWVGPDIYAGPAVTLLAVAVMLARQLAFSWWSAAYVLGYERPLSLALVADGVVTAAAAVGWVWAVGPAGAALGSLTGAVVVYLPTGLVAVAAGLGVSPVTVLGWAAGWLARFAVVFAPVAVFAASPRAADPWAAMAVVAAGCGGYAVLVYGLTASPPLRGYRDRAAGFVRRLAGRAQAA